METLAARIDRAGPFETAEAVVLAARLARALEAPHERGEAHGAVNPESVKLARDARGAAVLRASNRSNPSFHHQSPERLAGGAASPEDDTWAIGSTLYLALTGTVPFPGDSAAEVAARIQQGSIAPLAVFDAGDDDLQELLQTMFHPDVAERTRSIVRVRKSLARWLAKRGIAAGPALEISRAESTPEVDLSSIPPPPRLPEMEDRPTIPRTARDASGVLYTFADEDTTLPRDAGPTSMSPGSLAPGSGPGSVSPSSSNRNPDAPFSSRLPPTSELLARAKAAPSREPPGKEQPSGSRGALNPAELASRLRSPSVPPGGPRLNPPKVARDRAARAASEPPPSGAPGSQPKPSSLRAPPLPRDMAALLGGGPDSSKPSSRPPPLPSSAPPSDKRSVPPLPVTSDPPSKRSTPPPLPVSASAPPAEARKSRPPRSSRPPPDASAKPKKRKPASEAPPAPEAVAAVGAPAAKSPALKVGIAVAVVAGLFAAYRLSSTSDPTPPAGSASSVPAASAPSADSAQPVASGSSSVTAPPGPSVAAPTAGASASASSSAAPPPASASSAVPTVPEGDVSACVVKLFASDSFAEGSHPNLDFVCREADPRLGSQKVHEVLVRAGMGRTVSDGMREWAVMGWYELAAYAALRGRCCADPRPIELPPSPGTCASMQDALSGVSKSARLGATEDAQKEALAAFKKSLSCTIKSGKAKPFGNYPRPAGGEDTAFLKTYQRTRNP